MDSEKNKSKKCLKCNKVFISKHSTNKLCIICKTKNKKVKSCSRMETKIGCGRKTRYSEKGN